MVSLRICQSVSLSVCLPACLPTFTCFVIAKCLFSLLICSLFYIRMQKHKCCDGCCCYCCCWFRVHVLWVVIGCRSFDIAAVIIVAVKKGGGSLFAIHNECEIYNPRTNNWMPIASMIWRRSRSGVTSLRKMLYVVGG